MKRSLSTRRSTKERTTIDSKQESRPTLLAFATAARNWAQRLCFTNLSLYFLSIVLCAGAVVPEKWLAWVLVMIALAFKLASIVVAARADHLHRLSREAQRLALLEDSLGKMTEAFQAVELRRQMGIRLEAAAREVDYKQPYYRSTQDTGPRRMAENIQQSTFWSKHLLDLYATKLVVALIVSTSIVGIIVYILLVVTPDSRTLIINPYLISLAALTLIMGLLDYVKLYMACKSSVALLNEVDQRLDKVDVRNNESIMANFADYSIASITAPPIPYRIYLKNRNYLVELWRQRQDDKRTSALQVTTGINSVVELEGVTSFGHLSKDKFTALVLSAAEALAKKAGRPVPNPVRVSMLEGLSGIPIFEIKLYQNGVLWRQLVLRLNPSPQGARQELYTVKRISDENVDVIAYCPLEEPFVSQGALFYYHANIQTNDELCSVDEFVAGFLQGSKGVDFASYFNKLFNGLRSVTRVYENIEQYSVITIAEASSMMRERLPPMFILDLRATPYNLNGATLTVSQHAGSATNGNLRDRHGFDSPSGEHITMDLRVLAISIVSEHLSAIDFEFKNDRCRCLFDGTQVSSLRLNVGETLRLVLESADCIQTLQKFLLAKNSLLLDSFNPSDNLRKLATQGFARRPLHLSFRHKDLHCKNCMASRSNFKILDVGDSGRGLICCDLARLEISLISHLVERFKLDAQAVDGLLELLAGQANCNYNPIVGSIARVLKAIRQSFYSEFKISPQEYEITIAYFLECCDQVSFSILSPIGLRGTSAVVVKHWSQKLTSRIRKSDV